MEAAQRYLEAGERWPVGSDGWAEALAGAFHIRLQREECDEVQDEVAKPEWWNDEGLKALSASVVRAAPNDMSASVMRAYALSGFSYGSWEAGPRSAAELTEAAAHWDRAAALNYAPAVKAEYASFANTCRGWAEAM